MRKADSELSVRRKRIRQIAEDIALTNDRLGWEFLAPPVAKFGGKAARPNNSQHKSHFSLNRFVLNTWNNL